MHQKMTEMQIKRDGYAAFRIPINIWDLACQLASMEKKISKETYGPGSFKVDAIRAVKTVAPHLGLLHSKLCYEEAVDFVTELVTEQKPNSP
jgi:hypothetical protein